MGISRLLRLRRRLKIMYATRVDASSEVVRTPDIGIFCGVHFPTNVIAFASRVDLPAFLVLLGHVAGWARLR